MPRVRSEKATFDKLGELIRPHEVNGRTLSAAMLIWFLETIFRLDEIEAQDAVCDQQHDAGIDALWVNDEQSELVLFQGKRKESLPSTLGDTELKRFVGSLKQFDSPDAIKSLAATTRNQELSRLLLSNEVAEKVAKGYRIRGIFVCNIAADESAKAYVKHASAGGLDIDLWDLERLGPVLRQLSKDWFVDQPITLRVAGSKLFHDGTKADPRLVYASVPAKELVRLPGIEDTRVFAQNVRLGLGRTRVNTEIIASIQDTSEHREFLAFHNGLTIVARTIRVHGNRLKLDQYSVCNGCQSLLAFYHNRKHLTDELEVLVRVVRVGEDRKLAESIAYRTNNQNAISLRDLSSNDAVQIRLKAEFDEKYGFDTTYSIKRGEQIIGRELHNEEAGRILLALYVRQPWSSHQKYRVFGDLQGLIFAYGINAPHIRLSQLVMDVVRQELHRVINERIRSYSLTPFVVLYVVGEVLRREPDGERLLKDPEPYLSSRGNPNAHEASILTSFREMVDYVIFELNYFVEEHGGDSYDYKSEFKSQKAVGTLKNEVLRAYDKDKFRDRATAFTLPV